MSTQHPHDITDARALLAANVGTPVRLDLPLLARRVAAESDGTKLKLRLFSDARGDEREELGVGWVFAREWYPGAAGTRYSHYFLSLVRAFEGLERAGREPTLRLQLLQAVRAQAPRGLQTVLLKFIIAPEYALTGTMLETVYGCPLASLYTTFVGVTFDPKRDRKPPDWTRGNAIHAGYRRAAETFARDRRPESTRAAYYEGVRASWQSDLGALLMDRPKSGPKKLHTAPIEAAEAVVNRCDVLWPEGVGGKLLHERLVYVPSRGLVGRIDRLHQRGVLIHLTEIKTGGGFGQERDPLTGAQHSGGVQALAYRELLAAGNGTETAVDAFIEELETETPSLFPLQHHPVVTRAGATLEPEDDRGLDLLAQNRNVGYVAGSGLLTGYDRHRLDDIGRKHRSLTATGGDWSLYGSMAPCQMCAANSRGVCGQSKKITVAPLDNLFRYAPAELFAYWTWFHHQLQEEHRHGREWLFHLATTPAGQLEGEGVTISGLAVASIDGFVVEFTRDQAIATRMREDDRVLVGLHGLRPGDATSVEGTIESLGERSVRVRVQDVLPDRTRKYRLDDLSRHGMPDWQTQGLTDFLVTAMETTPVRGRELSAHELPSLARVILGVGGDSVPLPVDPEVPSFLGELNAVQRHALGSALALTPESGQPLLIQGPPGTGKTSLIAELVHAIALQEFGRDAAGSVQRPVLLLANSHRAVDELVLKLASRYPDLAPFVVRVGQPRGGMDPSVRARVLSEAIGAKESLAAVDMAAEGAERLVALIREGNLLHDQAMIFAGTLAAAQGPDLRGLSFRTVIVDECGQATEPAALQALRHMTAGFRSRLILVGDHRQLPPVVPDPDPDDPPILFDFPEELAPSGLTREHTLKTSLFERLASRYPQRLTTLRDQYRMNAPICDLVSNTFYEGRLQPGTPEVAERRLTGWFSAHGIRPGAGFVADGPPVQFIDTSNDVGGKDRDASLGDDSRSNEREAEIIAALVSELVDGLSPAERAIVLSQLGIISPYRRQNNAIQLALAKRDPQLSAGVRVDTVDRFQGGEKEIVFVSLTNSNAHATIGRLHAEWRRMNVAISRAKRMLVIIGDRRTFTAVSDEAEESAKARYRRLFAEIDRLCAAGEARIAASEGMGPVT